MLNLIIIIPFVNSQITPEGLFLTYTEECVNKRIKSLTPIEFNTGQSVL